MKKLSPMQTAFLLLETRATPMHTGALALYRMPARRRRQFVRELVAHMQRSRRLSAPFDQCLAMPRLKIDMPSWSRDEQFEASYHVRHVALPEPGDDDSLMTFVSGLHGQQLDRSRPLWECYVIEGLEGDRFAIYFKIHQAASTGRSAADWMQGMLRSMRTDTLPPPAWQQPASAQSRAAPASIPSLMFGGLTSLLRRVTSVPGVTRTLTRTAKQTIRREAAARLPYVAPRSVLNQAITGHRVIRLLSLPRDPVRRLANSNKCSERDIALALFAGALRRRLQPSRKLPKPPLVVAVPLTLQPSDSGERGEAIAALLCSLGTDIKDPAERLAAIRTSMASAASGLSAMTVAGVENYSGLIMAPFLFGQMLHISPRGKPAFNLFVSVDDDAPTGWLGPAQQLASYSLSPLWQGQALNLAVSMKDNQLHIAVTGCPDVWPAVAEFDSDIVAAMDELAALLPARRRTASS